MSLESLQLLGFQNIHYQTVVYLTTLLGQKWFTLRQLKRKQFSKVLSTQQSRTPFPRDPSPTVSEGVSHSYRGAEKSTRMIRVGMDSPWKRLKQHIFLSMKKTPKPTENMVEISKTSNHVKKVNMEVTHSLITQELGGASYNYQLADFQSNWN